MFRIASLPPVLIFFFAQHHLWARVSSFKRFLDHTHTYKTTHHIRQGLLWTSDYVTHISNYNIQHTQQTEIHATGGIRTHNLGRRPAAHHAAAVAGSDLAYCNFKYAQVHILDTLFKSPFQRYICLARSVTSASEVSLPTVKESRH
jgi:hypothetical protein